MRLCLIVLFGWSFLPWKQEDMLCNSSLMYTFCWTGVWPDMNFMWNTSQARSGCSFASCAYSRHMHQVDINSWRIHAATIAHFQFSSVKYRNAGGQIFAMKASCVTAPKHALHGCGNSLTRPISIAKKATHAPPESFFSVRGGITRSPRQATATSKTFFWLAHM